MKGFRLRLSGIAALLLLCCLLTSGLAAGAESTEKNGIFFAGYRWLSAYSALFSDSAMTECTGITTEKGLVWALNRENGCLSVIYLDQSGNEGRAYVEEARTARVLKADITAWLKKTGKKLKTVQEQELPPVTVGNIVLPGEKETAAQPAQTPVPVEEAELAIQTQPQDQTATAGTDVSFTLSASGVKTYQWQYSKDDGKSWDDLKNAGFWRGNRSDTLTFAADAKYDGFLFRCVISDGEKILESSPAALSFLTETTPFDQNPEDKTAASGETVSFQGALQGAKQYQWQYSSDGGKSWSDLRNGDYWAGNHTDTLSFKMDPKYDGFLFRLSAVRDGEILYSPAAGLTLSADPDKLPVVLAQSGDQTVHAGESVSLSVQADRAEGYQWEYSRDSGETWARLSNADAWAGNTSATLTFTVSDKHDMLMLRCTIMNSAGSVHSTPVLLSVMPAE